jgi:hypothetical protein
MATTAAAAAAAAISIATFQTTALQMYQAIAT